MHVCVAQAPAGKVNSVISVPLRPALYYLPALLAQHARAIGC